MAVSRQREYLADASAAELTRNPAALASALEKIDLAAEPTRSIKKGTAHLCIADPLARDVNDREGFLADLFATHPPIKRRIMILSAMAYQNSVTSPGRPPESSAGQPQRIPVGDSVIRPTSAPSFSTMKVGTYCDPVPVRHPVGALFRPVQRIERDLRRRKSRLVGDLQEPRHLALAVAAPGAEEHQELLPLVRRPDHLDVLGLDARACRTPP